MKKGARENEIVFCMQFIFICIFFLSLFFSLLLKLLNGENAASILPIYDEMCVSKFYSMLNELFYFIYDFVCFHVMRMLTKNTHRIHDEAKSLIKKVLICEERDKKLSIAPQLRTGENPINVLKWKIEKIIKELCLRFQ